MTTAELILRMVAIVCGTVLVVAGAVTDRWTVGIGGGVMIFAAMYL